MEQLPAEGRTKESVTERCPTSNDEDLNGKTVNRFDLIHAETGRGGSRHGHSLAEVS